MKRQFLSLGLIAGLLAPTMALAEYTPKGSSLDPRVRVARYVDGQVYNVALALTHATAIEFEPGETIVSVVAGDTEAFKFHSVPGGRVLSVKPLETNIATNLTVYTTQRSYYFHLGSRGQAFYVVRFKYPARAQDRSRAVAAARTARTYGVNTKNDITPQTVWDDGTFTYFRFGKGQPVPAIFKVTRGLERSVNSTQVRDGVMRVSGISKQWAVRLGEMEVCIAEMIDGR